MRPLGSGQPKKTDRVRSVVSNAIASATPGTLVFTNDIMKAIGGRSVTSRDVGNALREHKDDKVELVRTGIWRRI